MFGLSFTQTLCFFVAMFCSFVCVFNVMQNFGKYSTLRNIKRSLCAERVYWNRNTTSRFEARVIDQISKSSYATIKSQSFLRVVKIIEKLAFKGKEIELAGFRNSMSTFGLALTRMKLAVLGGIIFMVFGSIFSFELMMIGLLAGLVSGFTYPDLVLKKRIAQRTEELERHLPEMLEILSIGMRSGLSFDRSLEIYSSNFNTGISNECANAQKLWMSGIKSRDCALRDLAKGYDSVVFSRAIESIIRNLRLGTSISQSLLSASREARANYKAKREEAVRKAPIKMMIPTGTLILPAMLLLIMGPVMLELIGGT